MPGRHLRRQRYVALLAACGLTLAACGEDSGDSSAPDPDVGLDAPPGLSVMVEPTEAAPGSTIAASVRNDTSKQFTYGAAHEVERLTGDAYERVELPPTPIPEIGYVAKPGELGPPVEVELPDDLEPGTYRVILQPGVPNGELAGGFEVVGDTESEPPGGYGGY